MGTWIPGEPPDAARIVREGYDRIGADYLAWTRGGVLGDPKGRYLARVLREVHPGARVLDLGCGPGDPVLQALAGRFRAVGVDLSQAQLRIAVAACRGTSLVQADVTRPLFRDASFDAVVSFFVLLHVPAAEHPELLERIAAWLRPGGRCYLSSGAGDGSGGIEGGWLGVPMYFGGVDADTTVRLARGAGLEVESADVIAQEEDGEALSFLWLVARKAGTSLRAGALRPVPPEPGVG